MAISTIGGTGSDNWELISSVTPTAFSAAVNFTGLSLYKKLMVVCNAVTITGSDEIDLRINNDSNNNYLFTNDFTSAAANPTMSGFTSKIVFTRSQATISGRIEIHNCDNAGIKKIEKGYGGTNTTGSTSNANFVTDGIYLASAVVTQINIITDSTFAGAGTVALYGVK